MAETQSSLHFEIQNLKGALLASQKQADKYALLITSLSYELDNLKNNICHTCKKKLIVAPATSVSPPSAGQSSISTAFSASSPLWRRLFQGRHRDRSSHKSLSVNRESEVTNNAGTHTPTHSGPDGEIILSPKPQAEPPEWLAVYHSESKEKQTLDFHLVRAVTYESAVYCAKMSPDGQRLAIGLKDGKTYINETKTGTNICLFVDRYVKDEINILSVQFSPDGRLLATGASDNQIRIWDIAQKRMRAMFKGHKNVVNGIVFTPDGHSLISGSDDRSVRIWNMRDGSSKALPVTGTPSIFLSVAISPNRRYIAGGNWDHSLWIWDSRTHNLVAKWCGHTGCVWCTEFTPDGKGLMSGSSDATVNHWDVSTLGIQQGVSTGLAGNGEHGFPEIQRFQESDIPVRSVAFFLGGQWIVTGSADKSVRVWDTQSGLCQLSLQGHMGRVLGVDVSETQNLLVTAGDDRRIALWRYDSVLQNDLS